MQIKLRKIEKNKIMSSASSEFFKLKMSQEEQQKDFSPVKL